MHTIADLRKSLGLATTNQVRNRIDAVKDLLTDHLRRGPNNQILLTDGGVAVLRRLQDLYDSGLTISEASDVLRSTPVGKVNTPSTVLSGIVQNEAKETLDRAAITRLEQELSALQARVAALEARQPLTEEAPTRWWDSLREEVE